MARTVIFQWGYWGWGNATTQFVESADAVEGRRGYGPPVFVDIRISRAVRARGFNGNAFGTLVGATRYRHLPALGNLTVLGQPGPAVQLKDPTAVDVLLDLAFRPDGLPRRLIFFCSCEFPGQEGQPDACHRATVGRLLLEAAQRMDRAIEVVEWPGGDPEVKDMQLTAPEARRLLSGGRSIRLAQNADLADFACTPWGTIVRIQSPLGLLLVAVGPAQYRPFGWCLTIPWQPAGADDSMDRLRAKVREWRREFGLEPRWSLI